MSLVERLAASAAAPLYLLVGDGGRPVARSLAASEQVELMQTPRHASILVMAGRLPGPHWAAARAIHDQLSAPRATIAVRRGGAAMPLDAIEIDDEAELEATVVEVHRALMTGARASEPPVGPAESPVPWQGVGPHGQGGEGMMGGKPYGRPMAMTGDDLRDGLALDPLQVPLGPFLPWLPPGLCLDVTLQGDVVQRVEPQVAALWQRDEPAPMQRAAETAVRVADIELARARHHLQATADLLELQQLRALGERVRRLARRLTPDDAEEVTALSRRLHRLGALRGATDGVGRLEADLPGGQRLRGPVARAAGSTEDARSDDPAYEGLGFRVITHEGADAHARYRQRLAEAAQALRLARRAGDRQRPAGLGLEGCRGPLHTRAGVMGAAWRQALQAIGVGAAFDAFVTALVSLDLDATELGVDEEKARS